MTGVEILGKAALDVAAERGVSALVHLKWRFLACRIWRPKADLRVSYSAFLRICRDNRYLLVLNLHRKGTYAPIGGVYKYASEGRRFLDSLDFRPEKIADDMIGDLRGYIPRKQIAPFDRWFRAGEDRESATDCIAREVREEMLEIGLSKQLILPPKARFRPLRVVTEGPESVVGKHYTQFRQFEFYDFASEDAKVSAFVDKALELGRAHPGLLVASAEEILNGRSKDGRHIAHHAAHFFQTKRVPREEPLFATG